MRHIGSLTVIINYLLMIYYALASFTNLRMICSETLNVSLNPIPQPNEWLRRASTLLKQKHWEKRMFLHSFQFVSAFKLPCYVFIQKSTFCCICRLEISRNRNLQPAFTCCCLDAIAGNLANNMVLMGSWTALSSALTPQELNGDTHWFFFSCLLFLGFFHLRNFQRATWFQEYWKVTSGF